MTTVQDSQKGSEAKNIDDISCGSHCSAACLQLGAGVLRCRRSAVHADKALQVMMDLVSLRHLERFRRGQDFEAYNPNGFGLSDNLQVRCLPVV
ncbi:hypothetical protein LIA77_10971 [Sarocladium implicatum]|nr:hypothetical protein LIA77_10971 [Sarocladium implicatum]